MAENSGRDSLPTSAGLASNASSFALSLISILSILIGFLFSPADPFSFYILTAILLALSLGSYFAGLSRGRRRNA